MRPLPVALLLTLATLASAQTAPTYVDPVPHEIITQPYRVCQDLEELTARINNLYRKPFHKLFEKSGAVQPETIFFKDTTSGHEVMTLTRELCSDMAHGDLGRPAWTFDGKRILFMGNRANIDHEGKLKKMEWAGQKFIMNADYSDQRALIIRYPDGTKSTGIDGKYNMLDPQYPNHSYYAVKDKLWRVVLSDTATEHNAELVCTFATAHRKIIQGLRDGKLLIQDLNADLVRPEKKRPEYMPEIHLVDLKKKPGEPGFYYHHPFDYGLPEVKDAQGKIVHDAKNNYQFHSMSFGKKPNTIGWSYGPMTSVGEPLGWTLDTTNGLDGTPVHPPVSAGAAVNPFGQYESHGGLIGPSSIGLYFGGPATLSDKKRIGSWGLWMRDYADAATPPAPDYLMDAVGGHVAGGRSCDPHHFAAHIGAGDAKWRARIKEADAIVYGDVREKKAEVLCYTYSDVRGGTQKDRKTGKLVWSGMDNNDYRPYSSIPRPLISPDGTKVLFHSCMLQPTEDWVGMYVAVLRRPDPPTDLKLVTRKQDDGKGGIALSFKPAALSHETKTYHLYRAESELEGKGRMFVEIPTTFATVEGTVYCSVPRPQDKAVDTGIYAITAEEWSGLESDTTSNTVGAAGKAGDAVTKFDLTPPAAPANFRVAAEPDEKGQYRLTWDKSAALDVRYYNIYFSKDGQPETTQKRLVASPIASMTSYLDWSALVEGGAFYAITAVDRQGNESKPAFGVVR